MGESAVDDLNARIAKLEWELQLMQKLLGARGEAKTPASWANAERLGAKIAKEWKLNWLPPEPKRTPAGVHLTPSWKLVSEQRRLDG